MSSLRKSIHLLSFYLRVRVGFPRSSDCNMPNSCSIRRTLAAVKTFSDINITREMSICESLFRHCGWKQEDDFFILKLAAWQHAVTAPVYFLWNVHWGGINTAHLYIFHALPPCRLLPLLWGVVNPSHCSLVTNSGMKGQRRGEIMREIRD